ncbi:hypothetical protein C8Q74DRAFT_1371808 [Fomes fomentarius]|nr:hypothetical protein C8Q74DRAFT_1371808 [Fomes fomentarius]
MSTAHKMVTESMREKDLLGAHSHRLSYAPSSYDPLVNTTDENGKLKKVEVSEELSDFLN